MRRFELVNTVERFIEVEPAWGALWQASGAKAFQSHPWIAAWVKDMGPSYGLRIALIWQDDERLAAILPMTIRKVSVFRILEWAGQSVCDYCDGIGAPVDMQAAWRLLRQSGGVDIIRLKNIASDAAMAAQFMTGHMTEDDVCLKVVSAWASGDAWFQTLNKKKRNNFARGQRILEEYGSTKMTCYETVPDETLIVRLYDLKHTWLKGVKQTSYLIDDKHRGRLSNFARALAEIGRLRLFVITSGADVVAASLNIAEGRSIGAFFAAYDPKYDRASPGILLMTAYTRWAFNNGFAEIDYLRGDEGYKLEFSNARTTLSSLVSAVSLRGHAALVLYNVLRYTATSREKHKNRSRSGGAYTTKAGTARAMTVAE